MVKTKITSIRLDADLLEKASAFGLNVSRVCEVALQNEINRLILKKTDIVPKGTVGISKNSRIIVAEEKFKDITKVEVGDRVLSYNISTNGLEYSNVIDVGPLTSEKAFTTSKTIENAIGTKIEVLPYTKIFCWKRSVSDADWIPAKEIDSGLLAKTVSHKKASGSVHIVKVEENHVRDIFYRLEAYPNNNFFANSNPRRMLHYSQDYMPSVWAFPVKGYLGKIGILLEQGSIHPKE